MGIKPSFVMQSIVSHIVCFPHSPTKDNGDFEGPPVYTPFQYDPAIPLEGIYLKEMQSVSQRDSYTSVFIVALYTIAKIWKQPKCPSTD